MGMTWTQWRDAGLAFLVGVLLSALAAILIVQASESEAAASYAAVVADPTATVDTSDMEVLAARFAVTIVWTDDDRNCGAGCHRLDQPNTIFVMPGLDAESTRHIVLHEIGHVLHQRVGHPSDECAADRFAQSMGSTMSVYCSV